MKDEGTKGQIALSSLRPSSLVPMPYLRDRAIILRSDPFREHDRKVVMFGMQHGLLEAVARGASASQAKQGGHVVPMTVAEVLVAKGAAFDKLAVARTVHAPRALRRRLGGLAFVGSFFDLFTRLQRPGIVDLELYELLSEVLELADTLPDEPSLDRTRLLFASASLKLMDRMGFAPPISACASCREPFAIVADASNVESLWLLPIDGAFVCPDCYRTLRRAYPNAHAVSPSALGILRFARREPLARILALTGTSESFHHASSTVFTLLEQTPLLRAPHGPETIGHLLS